MLYWVQRLLTIKISDFFSARHTKIQEQEKHYVYFVVFTLGDSQRQNYSGNSGLWPGYFRRNILVYVQISGVQSEKRHHLSEKSPASPCLSGRAVCGDYKKQSDCNEIRLQQKDGYPASDCVF